MPTNHRGQGIGDNHFNLVQWGRENSGLYGYANVHPNLPGEWSAEVYPNDGGEGFLMDVREPHWRDETGESMDEVGWGHYRTENRAKIAAESLIKREAEGRDMQTGRKDYRSRSGGEYTQPKNKPK